MEATDRNTQRPIWSMTAVDLQNLEMTLTAEEWHRCRDHVEVASIIVLHEPELLLAS